MHSTSLLRCCVVGVGLAAMIFTGGGDQAWSDPTADEQARKDQYAKYEKDTADHLQAVYTQWRHARSAGEKKRLADNLYDAAIRADRPDVAEEAVAGGPLEARQISPPRHSFDVPLHVIHRFDEITVDPADRVADAPNQSSSKWYDSPIQNRWLARRLTTNALEVWTPVHGWLFDGRGRLLSEARSPVDKPMGRQWYGAFLPDGRWVTTDIEQEHPYPEKSDFSLTFFSREGTRLKTIPARSLPPKTATA